MANAAQKFAAMMEWLATQPGPHAELARSNLMRLEMTREALAEALDDRNHFYRRLAEAEQIMAAMRTVMDVMRAASLDWSDAERVIDAARDCAPFRNVMSTMYGLGPLGEDRPAKRRRAKA